MQGECILRTLRLYSSYCCTIHCCVISHHSHPISLHFPTYVCDASSHPHTPAPSSLLANMTPKADDFFQSEDSIDLEAGSNTGIVTQPQPVLTSFSSEIDQIQTLITNARVAICDVDNATEKQLEYAEKEVRVAFKQLSVLAVDNHKQSWAPSSRRNIGTSRSAVFAKCTYDILQVIALLSTIWTRRHEQLTKQPRTENITEMPPPDIENGGNQDLYSETIQRELDDMTRTIEQLRVFSESVRAFGDEVQDSAAGLHATSDIGFAEDFVIAQQQELQTSLRKSKRKVILLVMIPCCVLVIVAVVGVCFFTKTLIRRRA